MERVTLRAAKDFYLVESFSATVTDIPMALLLHHRRCENAVVRAA